MSRAQIRLPAVRSVPELLAINTTGLRLADLCSVNELEGMPPRDPRLPLDRWTGIVVFSPNIEVESGENDTWWRAPTGGFWLRVRDIA